MALRRISWRRALPVLVLASCLAGAGLVQDRVNQARRDLDLPRLDPLRTSSPTLDLANMVLGGFRGLFANLLWIRANKMQEAGRYYEMVQLADLITRLQPGFVTPWIHSAWNLSYNISVKFPDHQDRWKWVRQGVELLRDRGIPANPREPMLYRELAWHFQHKMGDNMDDAHRTYKREWAAEMEEFFPGGSPDLRALSEPATPEEAGRARRLREVYKMDPGIIGEVEERYGPLEWRLPETHSVYWAYAGLGLSRREDKSMNLRRSIFQSMQKAFLRGHLAGYPVSREPLDENADPATIGFLEENFKKSPGFWIDPERGMAYETYPNLDIAGRVSGIYEEMMEAEVEQRENIATGHKNFLRTAVYFLYVNGREAEAAGFYDYCRELYPGSIEASLEEYVFDRVEEEIGSTSQDRLKAVLQGLIRTSFRELSVGNGERAQALDLLAGKMWRRFAEEITEKQEVRVGLPTVQELKDEALRHILDPEGSFLPPLLVDRLKTLLGEERIAHLMEGHDHDAPPDPGPED